MYIETSKQQQGFPCKNSHQKCFKKDKFWQIPSRIYKSIYIDVNVGASVMFWIPLCFWPKLFIFKSIDTPLKFHWIKLIFYWNNFKKQQQVLNENRPFFFSAGGANALAGVLLLRLPWARRSLKMPPFLFFYFFLFFFRCRKLGCRSWAIPLYRIPIAIWAHVNTTFKLHF